MLPVVKARSNPSRWADFDPEEEMREGIVLSVSGPLGSRISLSASGKYVGEYNSFSEAIARAAQWMDTNKYYPNVFFVNDHGNVDLLSLRVTKTGRVSSRVIQSWV